MKTLLLSHFFNEEFLLPHWISHHLKMFDRAVLVNYASTDKSVEIIRTLAPNWEIRNSRNVLFEADKVDLEIMDIEREFDGYWKICLNTTEFLTMPYLDLKSTIYRLLKYHPNSYAIRANGVLLIDKIQDADKSLKGGVPLIYQRHWGKFDTMHDKLESCDRCRVIHCKPDGRYKIGRHLSFHPIIYKPPEIYCVWAGWSPYRYIKQRKLQIQTKIPSDQLDMWGTQHKIEDAAQLDKIFRHHSGMSYDLFTDNNYKSIIKSVYKTTLRDVMMS